MNNTTTKPVFYNTAMSTAIVDVLKTGDRANRAMAKLADIAVAELGSTAALHFVSPKTQGSLATEETWIALKEVVVSTFSAAEKRLLAIPKGAVSDDEKEPRRRTSQKIGSKIKDIKNAIDRRLGENEPKEQKAPRAPDVRIRDAAQDIIKVCENIESPTFRPAEIKALAEQIIRSI
jgi:hypothetical protein